MWKRAVSFSPDMPPLSPPVDRRGCDGVSHVEDTESLNSLSWVWPPRQSGIVSVKINCLSSEFVAKKHGEP